MSETKNLKLFKHDEPLESNESIFDIDKSLSKNWDKIDEYSVGIDKKIQALETDNTKNKEAISNIQEKIGDIDTILDTINGEVI
jgi:wobble nucleotide-excising tRNase